MNWFARTLHMFASQANTNVPGANDTDDGPVRSSQSMMDSDTTGTASFYSEFIPATHRKKRKQKYPKAPHSGISLLPPLREEIREGEWFAQCSQLLKDAWIAFVPDAKTSADTRTQVLCLGLGSPSASHNARIQLAFLAETCKLLDVTHDMVSIYDPVFTEEDHELFEEMNMRVLSESKSADYCLKVPTICFMPHCDLELYEALLRGNWSIERLSNLFLLGNSLQAYLDSKPTSALKTIAPCLLRAAPILENRALPPSSAWPTAFNNTSVQFAPPKFFHASSSDDIDSLFGLPVVGCSLEEIRKGN